MKAEATKTPGDVWFDAHGRIYVMVVVCAHDPCERQELVPMLVATGAAKTYLPPKVLELVGENVEIGIRTKEGRSRWVRPDLGPLEPRHANDQGAGVLGWDVLHQIKATIGGKDGFVVGEDESCSV